MRNAKNMKEHIMKTLLEKDKTALLSRLAQCKPDEALALLNASENGLSASQADKIREHFGANSFMRSQKPSTAKRMASAFVNVFTVILFILALIEFYTQVLAVPADQADPTGPAIIALMVIISGILRFIQETKSNNAAQNLQSMISSTCCVVRDGKECEIPMEDAVVGDIVLLAAGDMVPADMRIIQAKDLFINQSSLTGESEPCEKYAAASDEKTAKNPAECSNLAFMGTNVLSGSATGVIAATGINAMFGRIASNVQIEKKEKTSFDKGISAVSAVLVRFMLFMVPVVFLINGITKHDWWQAAMFAVATAVGLTPEMLPMIVTTCLAKGAVAMSKKKVIIKNLNAIQDLGAIDVLCTDKTGTLTQDKVVLERHLNVMGAEDNRVLRHGYLNSYFQTGLKNLLDVAIIEHTVRLAKEDSSLSRLDRRYEKVDELPFDFERRRMSVVVSDETGKTQMVTKGAVEEMLTVCEHVEYDGRVRRLTDEVRQIVRERVRKLNEEGLRVLAVAQKTNPAAVGQLTVEDECEMVLIGYLAFLDPPKDSAAKAVSALEKSGVEVKVLTGDNAQVALTVCEQVGLNVRKNGIPALLEGSQIAELDDEQLAKRAANTTVFAKLSPSQKSRVVRILREQGHAVGFMGDGINDAEAMHVADVGISVDTAVDVAKESADIILLEKDLGVLEQGIEEGRRIYANAVKYIKITASSNFGNMFSVLAASVFLPFLPMEAIQLLLLNLAYDISCVSLPWDNVDEEMIDRPRKWQAKGLGSFMFWFGPVSSIFDIATYAVMFFAVCPAAAGGSWDSIAGDEGKKALFIAVFQTGWFIESMCTQTAVIHMIRTSGIPFLKSRASLPVSVVTCLAICVLTAVPFTPLGSALGLTSVPSQFFAVLAVFIACYLALSHAAKKVYIRKHGDFL